jgi:hypothetical protein
MNSTSLTPSSLRFVSHESRAGAQSHVTDGTTYCLYEVTVAYEGLTTAFNYDMYSMYDKEAQPPFYGDWAFIFAAPPSI